MPFFFILCRVTRSAFSQVRYCKDSEGMGEKELEREGKGQLRRVVPACGVCTYIWVGPVPCGLGMSNLLVH